LRHEFAERVKRHGSGRFRIDCRLLQALLRAGRYRHVARSIAALIELAELKAERLSWELLPDDHLVGLQVDRGPLDAKTIGGSIALSGFGPFRKSDRATDEARLMGECWTCVAKGLWTEGATLAFAGRWRDQGASALVDLLLDALSYWPQELSRNEFSRLQPACRFRSFAYGIDPDRSLKDADEVLPPQKRQEMGVDVVARTYLEGEELEWGAGDWRARVLERSRRRWAVSESSVARFVIAGNRGSAGDRPSGVVEETVQTLALRRPIYLAGGFGGATRDLGIVLGVSHIRTGRVPEALRDRLDQSRRDQLGQIADRLKPPPFTTLPVFPDEQVEFLRQHAFGGKSWPDNGLSAEQNRTLFHSEDSEQVKRLVVEGLGNIFSGR
jgi:hypothetical protein